jgi:SAM-dependent methyltransferase
MKPLDRVRAEFDEIADLSDAEADRLGPHEAEVLRAVPDGLASALDAGCGTGAVVRRLAARCGQVTGIDLSPRMIAQARSRSAELANVDFRLASLEDWLAEERSYDLITAMAVLHHLELAPAVTAVVRALAPEGWLVIVDLIDRSGWRNIPINVFAKLHTLGTAPRRRALRRAWSHHGEGETYLTISQARETFGRLLPGCEVREHLFWRYSVVWRKPAWHVA